jgi:hypothetical protein
MAVLQGLLIAADGKSIIQGHISEFFPGGLAIVLGQLTSGNCPSAVARG